MQTCPESLHTGHCQPCVPGLVPNALEAQAPAACRLQGAKGHPDLHLSLERRQLTAFAIERADSISTAEAVCPWSVMFRNENEGCFLHSYRTFQHLYKARNSTCQQTGLLSAF